MSYYEDSQIALKETMQKNSEYKKAVRELASNTARVANLFLTSLEKVKHKGKAYIIAENSWVLPARFIAENIDELALNRITSYFSIADNQVSSWVERANRNNYRTVVSQWRRVAESNKVAISGAALFNLKASSKKLNRNIKTSHKQLRAENLNEGLLSTLNIAGHAVGTPITSLMEAARSLLSICGVFTNPTEKAAQGVADVFSNFDKVVESLQQVMISIYRIPINLDEKGLPPKELLAEDVAKAEFTAEFANWCSKKFPFDE